MVCVGPPSHSSSPATRPSPQLDWQMEAPHEPATEHRNPCSTVEQSAEQPSPPTVLPSSHASVPATMESPHVVAHTVGGPALHEKPHSIVQEEEHPSLFWRLLSSHCSPPMRMPSPHTGKTPPPPTHVPVVCHPSSRSQALEQPSPLLLFPSSHSSSAARRASPQNEAQTDGTAEQLNPHSIVHDDEQPSLSAALPSSHVSRPISRPSPHMGEQRLSAHESPAHAKPGSTEHELEQPSPSTVLPSSHSSMSSLAESPQTLFEHGTGTSECQRLQTCEETTRALVLLCDLLRLTPPGLARRMPFVDYNRYRTSPDLEVAGSQGHDGYARKSRDCGFLPH
jgi:hypothetical protein